MGSFKRVFLMLFRLFFAIGFTFFGFTLIAIGGIYLGFWHIDILRLPIHMPSSYVFEGVLTLAGGMIFILFACFVFLGILFPQTLYPNSGPRVRVHVHDNMVLLTAEEDYQIAFKINQREKILGGKSELPTPLFYAVFSEKPTTGAVYSLGAYRALVKGCVVERSPMWFSNRAKKMGSIVSIEDIWKLVHGNGAIPPSTTLRNVTLRDVGL